MRIGPPEPAGSFLRVALILFFGSLVACAPPAFGQQRRWQESQREMRPGTEVPSDFVLGLEASQAIAKDFGLVETDSLVQRVNDIGYRVALVTGHPEILFTFQILNVDVPNAEALPGGWVFVTKGILEIGLTDAELAHVLGHEITHVLHRDFARQGKLDGLLSILQTAVFAAVAIAGSGSGNHSPVIEQPGSWEYSQTSGEAAIAGTQVFGSVFHELLMRGYSRKIEMEADEGGRRLAALAGYPREASVSLLTKLHEQIYEDREFGYWQTHPYFTDRIEAARGSAPGSDPGPTRQEVAAYRLGVQQGLATAAGAFRDEALADYLYGLALRSGTSEGSGVTVHENLLRFRLDRMDKKFPLLRPYGPLRTDYDSLLVVARRSKTDPGIIGRIQSMRDSVEALRRSLLPYYVKALNGPNANTQILEEFIKNFPEDAQADTMRFRLARSYRLSGRLDLAAEKLGEMLAHEGPTTGGAPDSSEARSARSELLLALPGLSDPEATQRLYDRLHDPELKEAVSRRALALADTLTSLDAVGRFVQAHPTSPFASRFRDRLTTLAENEYKKGRLGEALGDQQSALAAYNRVAILAPETPSAAEARRGIVRIQALATSAPER